MKRIFVIVLILTLLITGCETEIKQTEQPINNSETYAISTYNASARIQNTALICLDWANELSKHWNKAIQNNVDIDEMINSMLKVAKDEGLYDSLLKEKQNIDKLVNELNNPPKEYEKLYNKLLELYGEFNKVYNLATEPSGSLVSYNNSISNSLTELDKLFSELKVLLPKEVYEKIK